jgi:hypothetical protein
MKERQANAANHGRFEARSSSSLPIATGRRVDAYSTCPLRPACLPRYHPRQPFSARVASTNVLRGLPDVLGDTG